MGAPNGCAREIRISPGSTNSPRCPAGGRRFGPRSRISRTREWTPTRYWRLSAKARSPRIAGCTRSFACTGPGVRTKAVHSLYDHDDVAVLALDLVSASSWLRQQAHIFYYGFYDLTQGQLDLFQMIVRQYPRHAVFSRYSISIRPFVSPSSSSISTSAGSRQDRSNTRSRLRLRFETCSTRPGSPARHGSA